MPCTVLDSGLPANKKTPNPTNDKKSSKTRWLEKAEGQVDSKFAAEQFERICQLLCTDPAGPAAPAHQAGFTSKRSRVEGSRK